MERFTTGRILKVAGLLGGTALLLGISPALRDLIERVDAIEVELAESDSALVIFDGDGDKIGFFLGGAPRRNGDRWHGIPGDTLTHYVGLSDTDFMFLVNAFDGELRDNSAGSGGGIYFRERGCDGQGFATGINRSGLLQGFVFRSPSGTDPTQIYYVLPGSGYASNTSRMRSAFRSGSCGDVLGGTGGEMVPVEPNDPIVTGVSKTSFSLPIMIGRQ